MSEKRSVCEKCGGEASSFCKGCTMVAYCCYEHHVEDYKKHKSLCKMVNRCHEKIDSLGIPRSSIWGMDIISYVSSQMQGELIEYHRTAYMCYPEIMGSFTLPRDKDMGVDETNSLQVGLFCFDIFGNKFLNSIKTHKNNVQNGKTDTIQGLLNAIGFNEAIYETGMAFLFTLVSGALSQTFVLLQSPVRGKREILYQLLCSVTGMYTLRDYIEGKTGAQYTKPMTAGELQTTVIADLLCLESDVDAMKRLTGYSRKMLDVKVYFEYQPYNFVTPYKNIEIF